MSSPLAVISVISHSPAVITEFFAGLERLASEDPTVIFLFGDDSDNAVSKGLLEEFARLRPGTVVIGPGAGADQRVWRRAAMKDRLLGTAVELGCSHALVVDSNLMLPPPLMAHLVSLQLDIVAEVSWSEQEAGAWALPSVWQSDFYSLFGPELAAAAPSEQSAAANAFLAKLRQPGTYRVGAVSGCTLLSRSAIEAGTSFKAIANLSLAGTTGISASGPLPSGCLFGLTLTTLRCALTGKRTSGWRCISGQDGRSKGAVTAWAPKNPT